MAAGEIIPFEPDDNDHPVNTGRLLAPRRDVTEELSSARCWGSNVETLDRPFKVIAFDWDGTAVMSREEDSTRVRLRLERLLNLGVAIAIVSGTSFQNIDRQVSAGIVGPFKRRLYVCTNRGSEVYGFDERSNPMLLWCRIATDEENQKLTTIAERVRRLIESRTGLEIHIVYNRLNRRKIDLIPLPEWRDPPKSAIGELLLAVEGRLKEGGIIGGLREVLDLTELTAREVGLAGARITSDVKHIEVGLTDKRDSVNWIAREIIEKERISPRDVLIGGDEFGPLDGVPGSDYLMVQPEVAEATFVSVGKEPNGVPAGVTYLGGGPIRFGELLDQQIALHERESAAARTEVAAGQAVGANGELATPERATPTDQGREHSWFLIEKGFNPAREHEIESVFSVGNGYLGTRGALPEGGVLSRPATFLAGVFDVEPGAGKVPELVKAPDWARLRIFVEGEELRLDEGAMGELWRILDMKRGMLCQEWRHRDAVGRITRLSYYRFASLADRHAVVESLVLAPENYGGLVAVEAIVEGELPSDVGVEYLAPSGTDEPQVLAFRVPGTGVEVAFAAATTLRPQPPGSAQATTRRTETSIVQRWEWPAKLGEEYRVDKLVAVYTSREVANPIPAAIAHLAKLSLAGAAAIREAHGVAWAERWKTADVEIAGNLEHQRGIRFAIYQLLSAVNPEDERVSIGARGLTGEAYKGHVFWDTETFMLPFYTFTCPEAARSLLMYRYHTLRCAQKRAQSMGYRGALYAWESTDTGEDVTPTTAIGPDGEVIEIRSGQTEHHISADVAYAVWQYWQATNDERFLLEAGAEILFETARFWASRVEKGDDGHYHIRGVIGPDEYHEGVDDNAFTNVMAQWNLEQGVATAALLQDRWSERWRFLAELIGLGPDEIEMWSTIARKMYTGLCPESGLYEQFKGYFGKEYFDLEPYKPLKAPIDVVLGHARAEQTQIIKQADVVMMLYLLWDRFPPEVREANFRYYEPRTAHGSSLSPAIHAAVAARLGDLKLAECYLQQAVDIDLANNMGNAAAGVHMATQGGIWQAVVFGFAGMHTSENGLRFDLRLPPSWRRISFPVRWRSGRLRVTGERKPPYVEASLEDGEPCVVTLGNCRPRLVELAMPAVSESASVPGDGEQLAR